VLTQGLSIVLSLAGIAGFTLLLAAVAASQQAFLSLTEGQARRLGDRGSRYVERLVEFVRNPHQLIITAILATGVFAAGATLSFVLLCLRLGVGGSRLLAGGLVVGLLLAVAGRALPRAVVSARPESFALRLVPVYTVVSAVFGPLTWAVSSLLARISQEVHDDMVATEEFKAVTEEDEDVPRLHDEKRELIHSIVELGGTTAREVMVPRIDMIMVEAATPRREVLKLIAEHGHSRIPVFDGSVDRIRGVVHVKQLVMDGSAVGDDAPIGQFARPVMFVPETKKIDELLHAFQQEKTHLAIVVDEYGGTSGMVTLEDVLEEIVGEIEDEYDKEEESLLEPLGDGSYRVAAKIDLDDLNEEMNLQLPTERSDTLGGFIYELVGKVPSQGEAVQYQNLKFIIDRVHRQRIIRVRIQKDEAAARAQRA
jgi:CBS domain containing-hemolysin-like protein